MTPRSTSMRPLSTLLALAASAVAIPLAASATAATTAATVTEPTVVTVPSSIDGTGATDVTAPLNAFLQAQGPDVVVSFPTARRYRVEGTLSLNSKQGFVLDGNGSEVFATTRGDRNRAHVRINGGEGVTVRELVVTGANPNAGPGGAFVVDLEAQHGIEVLGTQDLTLRNNTVRRTYGDFLYLARDQRSFAPTYRRPATRVLVTENSFSGSGRQGVGFTNARDVDIVANHIALTRRAMFDFEPNAADGVVDDVLIARNTLGDAGLNAIAGGGKGRVDNIMVRENTFVKQPMNTMIKAGDAVSRSNWSFVNNTSNAGFGSTLGGVVSVWGPARNISFVGNHQPTGWNRNMAGIQACDLACGIVAHSNVMVNATAQSRGGSAPCSS